MCRKARSNCTKQYLFNTLLPKEKLLDADADENVRKIKNITASVIGNSTTGGKYHIHYFFGRVVGVGEGGGGGGLI